MHTLNPLFALNRFPFQNVGVRSMLRVLVYDRRSALDSRLLGVATLPAAAIPASSGPIYMWLPLAPPSRKGRTKIARLQVRDGSTLLGHACSKLSAAVDVVSCRSQDVSGVCFSCQADAALLLVLMSLRVCC
jgi:hypothetical protein